MSLTDTAIVDRMGKVEGRVGVIESALEHGEKQFNAIGEDVRQIRKDFRRDMDEIKSDFKGFQKWVRGLVFSISGATLLFLVEVIRDLIHK